MRVPPAFRHGALTSVLVFAAAVAAIVTYQAAYAGRLYPGVTVLDLDLGGRSLEEAQVALETHVNRYAQTPLTLRYADYRWRTTPAALGLTVDAANTVRAAYLVGRRGGVGQRLTEQLAALRFGRQIEPILAFDRAAATAILDACGQELSRSPANAGLVIETDGTVRITPSRTGVALDRSKAVAEVQEAVLSFSNHDLELPVVEIPVTLTEDELARARDRAQRIVGTPLVLTAGGRTWTLTSWELAPLLSVVDRGNGHEVVVDEAGLTAHLDRIAKDVSRPPVDARLKLTGRGAEIVPAVDGEALDVASSRTMVLARIGHVTTVPLVVKTIPALQAEALADLKSKIDALLSGPTTFRYADKTWSLSAAELAEMLVVRDGEPGKLPTVDLDAAKLTSFVKGVAKQVDREPQNARFRFQGGKLSLAAESVDGLKVDVAATVAAGRAALATPGVAIPLQVRVQRPEVTSDALGEIVVKDLIMDATTSFAGSIPAKAHNIRFAASRLNGSVVPPGGIFSFNQALGPATVASGFQVGYGIMMNSDGRMETVPSEAGGICQVATTLFHAVFWAGYPVVERNWHLYWIARYGQPPRGLKGLDATVDDAYGVDFKFKNNTADWIVIEATAGDNVLRFALHGVKPKWQVRVGQPRITNVVPANRELVRQPDPTMPAGATLQVEAAEDGFDVSIERTVVEGDRVVDNWVAKAHYRPSRNVLLYGTKGATPTPQPTPYPTGTATPSPASTPTAARTS